MKIIEYFSDNNKQHWIKELNKSEWSAAKFLVKIINENTFQLLLGENGKLYIMIDEEKIVSFLTMTKKDCIPDDTLYPWLGFLFTFPEYRGNRYSEVIINHATREAKKEGFSRIYLATDHVGLYEKYGFIYKESKMDVWGEQSRIYYKDI